MTSVYETLDEEFEAHLLGVCSALGGVIDGQYVPGDEVLECLKDLKKYLKEEQTRPTRNIFLCLGKWKIVKNHLVSIILYRDKKKNKKINSAVVEVLVPLTWPLEKKDLVYYNDQLLCIKSAFLTPHFFETIINDTTEILAIAYDDRTEKQHGQLRLLLFLIRNILAIGDGQAGLNSSSDSIGRFNLQEKIIIAMDRENVLHLVTAFCGSMEEKEFADFNFIILEIIHLIFSNRNLNEIFEGFVAQPKLATAVEKQRILKSKPTTFHRHPRFGGCLMLKSNGKKVIVHNALPVIGSALDSVDVKKKQQQVKIREEYKSANIQHFTSNEGCKAFLSFAESLLKNGNFNTLMTSVKKDFDAEKEKVTAESYRLYFSVSAFFLKYFRMCIKKKYEKNHERVEVDFDSVTSIINLRVILFVHKMLHLYLEEKKFQDLQLALECLLEMLKTVQDMLSSENEDYTEIASNIQHNLFYDETIIKILNQIARIVINEPRSFLELLVETIHTQMKMLEKFAKSKRTLIIKKKIKSKIENLDKEDIEIEPSVETKSLFIEKEIKLEQIERGFAQEYLIDLYCHLLKNYENLTEIPMRCITAMFHRIFVKSKMEALFYKLPILNLFNKIISDSKIMTLDYQQELIKFVKFFLKKFFSNLKEYPVLFVQIFFNKTKREVTRIQDRDLNTHYDTFGINEVDFDSDDELEIRSRTLLLKDKIGIIVTVLVEEDKKFVLDWVQEILGKVIVLRCKDIIEDYVIPRESEGHGVALDNDKKLQLLFEIFQFSMELDAEKKIWKIPSFLIANDLTVHKDSIAFFIDHPFIHESGRKAISFLKKKKIKKIITEKDHLSETDAEIEVKPGLSWKEQIGLIVSELNYLGRRSMLDWIIEILVEVSEQRKSDVEFNDFVLPRPSKEHELTLDCDNKFELLLKTLMFDMKEDDETGKRVWSIGKNLSFIELKRREEVITQYLELPFVTEEGKRFSSYLRKKRQKKLKPGKNKIGSKKKIEDAGPILSAEFIYDSDDFDDETFFKAEAERRLKYNKKLETKMLESDDSNIELENIVDKDSDLNKIKIKRLTRKRVKVLSDTEKSSSDNAESDVELIQDDSDNEVFGIKRTFSGMNIDAAKKEVEFLSTETETDTEKISSVKKKGRESDSDSSKAVHKNKFESDSESLILMEESNNIMSSKHLFQRKKRLVIINTSDEENIDENKLNNF
ncbi:Topoisomerase 1-associated factor 1 [Clydaea vesicula]|uniref:Topoisomerase 1-associated factor 1 n=1 Tax=Clydaea vesicula TaxID=447962 RepID=A0AAD5XXX5_9FUNG|nr:Topoisomerase 1-associated factor 1 [Clydaea vesicula]